MYIKWLIIFYVEFGAFRKNVVNPFFSVIFTQSFFVFEFKVQAGGESHNQEHLFLIMGIIEDFGEGVKWDEIGRGMRLAGDEGVC